MDLFSLVERKGPYEPHGDVRAPSAPWKRRAGAGECAAHARRGREAPELFAPGWWSVRMLLWPKSRATYPVLSNLLVSRAGRRTYWEGAGDLLCKILYPLLTSQKIVFSSYH